MIYAVKLQNREREAPGTFWFLDIEKASQFYQSARRNPKVSAQRLIQIKPCDLAEYSDQAKPNMITPVEVQ